MRDISFKIYLQHEETGITSNEFDYSAIFSGVAKRSIESLYSEYCVIGKEEFVGCVENQNQRVFTGDILEHINDSKLFKWLVTFKNGCFGIQNIGVEGYLGDFYPMASLYFYSDRKTVGNIYENPELLKTI